MNLAAYLFGRPFVPPAGHLREIRMEPPKAPPAIAGQAKTNAEIRAHNVKRLLEFLADGPATVTEIAAELGLATPTVRRILDSLGAENKVAFTIENNVRLFAKLEQEGGAA